MTDNGDKETKQQLQRIGTKVLQRTHGFGKLILFGEHFVVYKVPALVGAIDHYTNCECTVTPNDSSGLHITDHRPAVPNYKTKKADEAKAAIQLVLDHFQIDTSTTKVELVFGGTLTCVSGIGASAAQVVSLARALSYELPRLMTEDEINAAGYEGEKGYHGTPSGIDNTAATFGGLLTFQRTDSDPIFTKLSLNQPIPIVFASTGITASTTTVVGDVRAKKEADPAWFDNLLQQYLDIFKKAETALANNNLQALGTLMNDNHTLLQQLTVSCPELDALVEAARAANAWGAKMSGTGRGGLVVALTPTKELQDSVAAALTAAGAPQVWKTSLA